MYMTAKQKQCLLAYLGYYHGSIDGSIGPRPGRLADKVRELVKTLSAENATLVDDMAQMIEEDSQSDMEMMGI